MVTDKQVRLLMKFYQAERILYRASAKAGMDEKTARKYLRSGRLPSELKVPHTWSTREDPFDEVWDDVRTKLEVNPGLEAKALFEDLQRRFPGRFSDGQLRTFQRRVKRWRALEGPSKEVYFPQVHKPGELCQSDFTRMNDLGITIQGSLFRHMIYHFVLTYSNWETGTVCFSESFENLSEGLQDALWELGGVPKYHQTDRLTSAVNKDCSRDEFTENYKALLRHYSLTGRKTQARSPHENGDVEQRHYRFKKAVEQSLMLRGSADFRSREEYILFLRGISSQLNSGRIQRFQEELKDLRRLPLTRTDTCKRQRVKVGPGSTIRVNHNVYSVNSRLIGEQVTVRLYTEHLEVWYGQRLTEKIPRLSGEGEHRINYRHIIDWLVRKPGAFENYKYQKDLFPTHRFRMAYDFLKRRCGRRAVKEYLKILNLSAKENESLVDNALQRLIDAEEPLTYERVENIVRSIQNDQQTPVKAVTIRKVELSDYDRLIHKEAISL